MGQLRLDGAIIAGPPASAGGVFPGTIQTTPLLLKAGTAGKDYQRATGILERVIASPSPAFLDLGEPGNTVTQALFLYFKSDGPILLRATFDDGLGGDTVSLIPVEGPIILEITSTLFLKMLEAQGNAKVEYLLAGNL